MRRGLAAAVAAAAILGAGPALASQSCEAAAFQVRIQYLDLLTFQTRQQAEASQVGQYTPAMRAQLAKQVQEATSAMEASLMNGCRRGETVSIPRNQTSLVQKVCDADQAIVAGGDETMCAIR
jgi:hypothetical protein